MSSSGPRREVAYRIFADEFNDATHTYAESDEDRAPKYLVTPTGARVNRLFVVGVLTEVEEVSDDVVRARVVDPTGAFVIYAGQYQPDALAFFERAEPPVFVAVTGKARTFQPEGSDRVFTSLRPESVNEVDADTRDRWVVQTAEHTLERAAIFGKALEQPARGNDLRSVLRSAGVKVGLASGIPRAIEQYGTTTAYLESVQEMAIDAARLVAGEIDAVERTEIAPDEGGHVTLDTSFASEVDLDGADANIEPEAEPDEVTAAPEVEEPERAETGETEVEPESESPGTEPEEQEEAPVEGEEVDDGEAVEVIEEEADDTEVEGAETGETGTAETQGPEDEPVEKAATEVKGTDEVEPDPEEAVETDEMYELSEEERAEVEENFDVGFESGAEIDSPESDPEAPTETESAAAREAETDESEAEQDTESAEVEPEPDTDSDDSGSEAGETDDEADEEAGSEARDLSDAELEDAVIELMKSEAGDGGIERETLVGLVEDKHGVEADAIEEAIQNALLGGRCFESGDDNLKPI